MKVLPGCAFCINGPEFDKDSNERTIIETPNFRVFPTLGQITEGYLLIVPKEHYASVGSLPKEMFPEINEIKKEVGKRIKKAYDKNPTFFEHGGIGQTIYHAHVHALPFPDNVDLFDNYHKDFPFFERINSLDNLADIWNTRGNYLFYEINGNMFAFYTPVKPMYARIAVANALGVPERANWRTMDRKIDEEMIQRTLEKLSK
ncbi:MAG: HIT family protein [Nanoarchaeota archaeon]